MTGSAEATPGYVPARRGDDDPGDAVPSASGSPAARDGVDTPDGEDPPGPAGGADSGGPFHGDDRGDDGEDARYVPL